MLTFILTHGYCKNKNSGTAEAYATDSGAVADDDSDGYTVHVTLVVYIYSCDTYICLQRAMSKHMFQLFLCVRLERHFMYGHNNRL